MAKKRSTTNQHGTVKLREKILRNGDVSLYLDVYQNGKRSYEFLKIYLTGDGTDKAVRLQAEALRNKRELEIIAGRTGIIPHHKRTESIVDLAERIAKEKQLHTWKSLADKLREYDGDATMAGITADWCRGFGAFLQDKERSNLGPNTAALRFQQFRHVLREAVRLGGVEPSIFDKWKPLPRRDVEHTWLTIEELRAIVAVKTATPVTRQAFLLGCYTGLRLSDIRRLTWGIVADGTVIMLQQKTKNIVRVPLSQQARKLIGERPAGAKDADAIFTLPDTTSIDLSLKTMAKRAKINKRLHFHASRHTFAVNYLNSGGDLYVLMRLLGHKDIKSTQIYADIVNVRLHEGVELIPGL